MNPRTLAAAGAAAGLLVWFAAAGLPWPARLFTAALLGPAPVLFLAQAQLAESIERPFPRVPVYVGSMISLWVLGGLSLAAGLLSGFSPAELGLTAMTPVSFLAWTAVGCAAALALVLLFKALGARESTIMREIVPQTPREKIIFVLLSISAGVCEEIAFRGFLIVALAVATGSLAAAAALSAIAFGVLHAHQNAAGALRATLLAAALTVPVLATGSLLAAIAAHTIIDIVGGLWAARWLFRS